MIKISLINQELKKYLKIIIKFMIELVKERNRRRKRSRFVDRITVGDVRIATILLEFPLPSSKVCSKGLEKSVEFISDSDEVFTEI
jgi:hypothetical protein